MKKLVLFSLSLILIAVGTARAGDFLDYGSAQLAISDIDPFDGGVSLILTGGKKMDDVTPGFSAEGEITKSIQAPEFSRSFVGTTIAFELDYFTIGGYGAYTHDVNDQFSIKGRAGLVFFSADVTASGGGFSASAPVDSSTELAFGFSGIYNFSDEYKIIGEYTIISDLTHLGVGVQMPLDF